MKKIPTLFKREFDPKTHKIAAVLPEATEGLEWVLEGEGVATVKMDGSCCAIINGEFYKRYDAKKGRTTPPGAIPCCDPDPITGHWPHWVKVDPENPSDKWFYEAYQNMLKMSDVKDLSMEGTYEALGPHFQANPYKLTADILVRHGVARIHVTRSFEGIRDFLKDTPVEGIVFWKDGEPQCKIKRSDFGLQWPVKM